MSSVVRERDDGVQSWSQIRFDSGERVLISIAGKPSLSVTVFRLAFAELIPVKKIRELNEIKIGDHDVVVLQFTKMFMPDEAEIIRPLAAIRNVRLKCASNEEARKRISEREASVNR